MHESLSILGALAAGILSFLSPCVLPLVPAYLAFMAGVNLNEAGTESHRGRSLLASVLFVLGFTLVFVLLGASATFFGRMLAEHAVWLIRISGGLLIVLGFHVTGLIRIPFLMYEKRYQAQGARGLAGAFLVGAAFAFGWTPCVGPILAGILALASTQETLGQGMLLLTSYSLGLGLPFILAALAMRRFLAMLQRFKPWLRGVEVVAGLLLIALGTIMASGGMFRLASMLSIFSRFSL